MGTSKEDEASKRISELLSVQLSSRPEVDYRFELALAEAEAWKEHFPELYGKVLFLRAIRHFRDAGGNDSPINKTVPCIKIVFSSASVDQAEHGEVEIEAVVTVPLRFPSGEHGTSVDYLEDFCTLNQWKRPKYRSIVVKKTGQSIHSCLVTLKSNTGTMYREQGAGKTSWTAKKSAAHLMVRFLKSLRGK